MGKAVVAHSDVRELDGVEVVTEHRHVSREIAQGWREMVDPGRDDRLHGRRDRAVGLPAASPRSSIPVISTMKNGFPPVRSAIWMAVAVSTRPPLDSRASSAASSGGSGSSRSTVWLGGRSPRRPRLGQLGARDRQDHRRTGPVRRSRRQPLDEIEHRRPQRVRVVEDQHQRCIRGQPLGQGHEAALDLLDEGGLVAPRLADAERQRQPFGDVGRLGRVAAPLRE